MTEDQQIEILTNFDKMFAHDNTAVQKVLKNTSLDANTTKILQATGDLHMAFLWANLWILLAAIIFSITLFLALRMTYKSARRELFSQVLEMIQVVQKDVEPLVEVSRNTNISLSSYVFILNERTELVINSVAECEEKFNKNTQELIKKIEQVANQAFESIESSEKVQKALEQEIESNSILRKEVAKQSSMIEKRDKKIIALTGVGYKQ